MDKDFVFPFVFDFGFGFDLVAPVSVLDLVFVFFFSFALFFMWSFAQAFTRSSGTETPFVFFLGTNMVLFFIFSMVFKTPVFFVSAFPGLSLGWLLGKRALKKKEQEKVQRKLSVVCSFIKKRIEIPG